MAPETIGIPLAFIIFITLILWFIIGTKGQWWLKIFAITISLYASLGIWQSTTGILGWPTVERMPQKFQIHWIVIDEPPNHNCSEKSSCEVCKSKGSIYVFAEDLCPKKEKSFMDLVMLKLSEAQESPRLYKMPYSKSLHKKADQINKLIRKGGKYFGTLGGEGDGKGDKGPGMGKKPGNGKKGGGFDFSMEQEPMFYDLPPPKFPEKVLN